MVDVAESIRKSILKWKKIAYEFGADAGTDNCDLCINFLNDEYSHHTTYLVGNILCINCPVKKITGRELCLGTPYTEWIEHQKQVHNKFNSDYFFVECPTCKEIAIKEIAFLIGVLKSFD